MSRIGITVKNCPGLGDKMQFTSLPENYDLATGQKLIEVDHDWIFDYNPYVDRESVPDKILDLWGHSRYQYPAKRQSYTSVAEKNAMCSLGMQIPIRLAHPRLYRFEQEPIRYHTTFAPFGKSNGPFPEKIVNHILKNHSDVAQVGLKKEPNISAHRDLRSDNIWDAVQAIASSQEFIGNSGLSWIAACYPRVWNKLVLTIFSEEFLTDFIGMVAQDHGSHWYDHRFAYYNRYEYDVGITLSYLKL